MTLRDVRDRINEAIEEGFGSYEIVDRFNIFDHFKDDCIISYEQAIDKLKWLQRCVKQKEYFEKQIRDGLLALDFGEEELK